MIGWFKKLVSGDTPVPPEPVATSDEMEGTIRVVDAWTVADRFLEKNPAPPVNGIQALVDAGAMNLLDASALMQVCDKITEHGYRNPINVTLWNELTEDELLEFIRWHGQQRIEAEYYVNEITVRELIGRFRTQ